MLYINKKPWQLGSLRPSSEKDYYKRREAIKILGNILGLGIIGTAFIPACVSKENKDLSEQGKQNNFSFEGMEKLYPAKANTRYILDESLTSEYHATHHNNFYEFINPNGRSIYDVHKYVGPFDNQDWKIVVKGKAHKTGTYFLEDMMKKLQLEERIYRFRCVERWSMVVPWTGFSLQSMIKLFEPQNTAKYVVFETANNREQMIGVRTQGWYPWAYKEGLRMDEAMNELSFMATGIYGKPLPKQNGAPVRLVVPWKYGL